MASKKNAAPVGDRLELTYRLADLPSSQHRAGLAALVLLVRRLEKNAVPGEHRLLDLSEAGASFSFDEAGLKSLLDEYYAASEEEVAVEKPWKDVEPLRITEEEVTDPKTGKKRTVKRFVYLRAVPKGAILLEADPTRDGSKGAWTHLWRTTTWEIFRGVPMQRRPFENRASGKATKDAAEAWAKLSDPQKTQPLPSTFFLGAQEISADYVSFMALPAHWFILQFWTLVAGIYSVQSPQRDGKMDRLGYAIAVPDVIALESFCEELPAALRQRSTRMAGPWPAAAIVDLAPAGGLEFLRQIAERLRSVEGARATSDLLAAVDVFHTFKDGNSVRLLGIERVLPSIGLVDEYARIRDSLWCPAFRVQRLLNLLAGRPWYSGFDLLLSKVDIHKPGAAFFRFARDADFSLKNEKGATMGSDTGAGAPATRSLEELVYRVVEGYVYGKLESKYGLRWDEVKSKAGEGEYNDRRSKIAMEAFLAVRSRNNDGDFLDYVSGTIFSVPQRLSKEEYRAVASSLRSDPGTFRTLLLLALSTKS